MYCIVLYCIANMLLHTLEHNCLPTNSIRNNCSQNFCRKHFSRIPYYQLYTTEYEYLLNKWVFKEVIESCTVADGRLECRRRTKWTKTTHRKEPFTCFADTHTRDRAWLRSTCGLSSAPILKPRLVVAEQPDKSSPAIVYDNIKLTTCHVGFSSLPCPENLYYAHIVYTGWPKNLAHFCTPHNFINYWPLMKLLSLTETGENLQ